MNPDRVLESFLEMVAIESPSWHEASMAAYCAEKLAEMGFSVSFDASAAETGSRGVLGPLGHGEALRGH